MQEVPSPKAPEMLGGSAVAHLAGLSALHPLRCSQQPPCLPNRISPFSTRKLRQVTAPGMTQTFQIITAHFRCARNRFVAVSAYSGDQAHASNNHDLSLCYFSSISPTESIHADP